MNALLPALACALLLVACGGDDDAPVPPSASGEVPASAAQSAETYVAYTVALAQTATNDTTEALGLGQVEVAPTSETADPVDID